MASSDFDELTKALVSSMSRRETLKMLFASALGSALGLGGIGRVQAMDYSTIAVGKGCPNSNYCGNDKDGDSI